MFIEFIRNLLILIFSNLILRCLELEEKCELRGELRELIGAKFEAESTFTPRKLLKLHFYLTRYPWLYDDQVVLWLPLQRIVSEMLLIRCLLHLLPLL